MTQYTYQERFRTEKGVFDEFTKRNLFYLSSRGFFDELISPIFVGKESNVFLASAGEHSGEGVRFVIVKIYRVQNCDFKKMYDYIKSDSRYEKLQKRRREIIFAWTQREFKNLLKTEQAGILAPKPLAVKHNVLVESLIGEGDQPAPQLKDAAPSDPEVFFAQLLDELVALYQKAGLVHGDLSSFNILNHDDRAVLIDFSQSTTVKSSGAHELLKRDIGNVVKFFRKLGVKVDEQEIFEKIVGK